jgi:hypothetical protein
LGQISVGVLFGIEDGKAHLAHLRVSRWVFHDPGALDITSFYLAPENLIV